MRNVKPKIRAKVREREKRDRERKGKNDSRLKTFYTSKGGKERKIGVCARERERKRKKERKEGKNIE